MSTLLRSWYRGFKLLNSEGTPLRIIFCRYAAASVRNSSPGAQGSSGHACENTSVCVLTHRLLRSEGRPSAVESLGDAAAAREAMHNPCPTAGLDSVGGLEQQQ